MFGEIGKATAGETMAQPQQNAVLSVSQSYQRTSAESSPKKPLTENFFEQIAELLFFLQNPSLSGEERAIGWILFESALRNYLAVKDCEV